MEEIIHGVVCAVVNEGKVLLVRRPRPPFEGLLALPGGKHEFGETLEQTATRELVEETGITSRFLRHLATVPEHLHENGRITGHFILQLCKLEYLGKESQGELETRWVDLSGLEELESEIVPSDRLMLREILMSEDPSSHYSHIEKTPSGYIQKEFRKI
jgi:8-oxo-dGTP diphosphatase